MLSSDRITNDAAGLTTLRSWVRNGGRLWVMLDRISPETVRALLGNAMNFTVIDRVALDAFELESIEPGIATNVEQCEYDQPIESVRVLLSFGGGHPSRGWLARCLLANVWRGIVVVHHDQCPWLAS